MIARRAPAPTRVALGGLALAVFLPSACRASTGTRTTSGCTAASRRRRTRPGCASKGTAERLYVASPALGGRRQPVDVYLPPGYFTHPARRYPVLYLLHGVPGRPAAFLPTVRMGVVEDELVARGRPSR